MEQSFFKRIKTELVHNRKYEIRNGAECQMFTYIDRFYNRHRWHAGIATAACGDEAESA
ncbi:IS3 family transposase [Bradyrhizobium sp. CNPSo 4010]|uniref:IS3 family transposase n=1 Tax=Bradyrhizobium agreste TaxID=2751811 RepID=A0ABS0PGJ1_9BRAD|nr:IS3 family transposase [Bradyrhizobium agreste]